MASTRLLESLPSADAADCDERNWQVAARIGNWSEQMQISANAYTIRWNQLWLQEFYYTHLWHHKSSSDPQMTAEGTVGAPTCFKKKLIIFWHFLSTLTTFWHFFNNFFLTIFRHFFDNFLTTFWELVVNFLTTFWQLFDQQHLISLCYLMFKLCSIFPLPLYLVATGLRTIQFLLNKDFLQKECLALLYSNIN
jgi:hypothetical protein